MQRFRVGLLFNSHRLLYHSTLGWRVKKKKNIAVYRVWLCLGFRMGSGARFGDCARGSGFWIRFGVSDRGLGFQSGLGFRIGLRVWYFGGTSRASPPTSNPSSMSTTFEYNTLSPDPPTKWSTCAKWSTFAVEAFEPFRETFSELEPSSPWFRI